ncbi:MAG: acylphosphatase [Eubacteriales bacterium]|nr:acylphosphatase [Eubacteriales bacterium]
MRRHYYFSGRVQAVGFRYTAYRTANRMGLTGWVENLEDGRVEMEVQGQAGTIDLFLQQLQTGGRILIEEMEQEERPLCTENDFWVRG